MPPSDTHSPMTRARRLVAWLLGLTCALALLVAGSANPAAAAPSFVRVAGATKIDTALAISAAGWPSGSTYAVLATGNNFPDALAGGPLAYALDAPILLTANKASGLEPVVRQELVRLQATNVVILGGPVAVNTTIEKQLSQSYSVERIGGATLYDTAALIAARLQDALDGVPATSAFLADGTNYPDALGAAPVAARLGAPIVFTPRNQDLKSATRDYLAKLRPASLYVLGGPAAVTQRAMDQAGAASAGTVTRVFGATLYDTNIAIFKQWRSMFTTGGAVTLATGRNFPDALAGGVFAAKLGAPLLLVDGKATKATSKTQMAVASVAPVTAYVFGGPLAVTDAVAKSALGGVPDVTIQSVVNFRDVAGTGAGLPLADGGHMVRGLVYRSAALQGMSATDKTKLKNAGLTDIYDLRTPGTAASHPDPAIGTARYTLINLYGTKTVPAVTGATAQARLASRVEINREFVTSATQRARLAVLLRSFAAAKGPVIVHCSEGKDRTGFVSAVLQLLAGVDQATIVKEYLLSNDARKALIDADVAKVLATSGQAAADARRIDLTVHPEQIQASLDAIAAYGGVDAFLTKGVGLSAATVDAIRGKLQGP